MKSSWTLTQPPGWVPNAHATDKGWVNPDTGEVLVSIGKLASNKGAGPAPRIVTLGKSKLNWKTGDNFDVYVTFDGAVSVTGTPRIAVTVGSNTRYANYTSGSDTNKLLFRYTIVSGDSGSITVADTIDLNGGTIVETAQKGKLGAFTITNAGSAYTGNLKVSFTGGTGGSGGLGVANVASGSVNSITLIEEGSGYTSAPTVVFTKLGSGAVLKPIIVGGVITGMTIVDPGSNYTGAPKITITDSGSGANATATCTIKDGGINTVTITNGGTNYSAATTTVSVTVPGSNAAATVALKSVAATLSISGLKPDLTGYVIDNTITAPTVTLLGGDNFKTGADIIVKAVFAEDMAVSTSPVSPSIPLTVGSNSRIAAFWKADENDPLRTFYFKYTVLSNDSAAAAGFIVQSPFNNPSTFTDVAGNVFNGTFTPPTVSTVTVNGSDAAAPTISSVTALSGTKKIGDAILISVNFSQKVTVTGSPVVNFTIGSAAKVATYYSGSGTTTLVFKYVVAEGDSGATAVGANALSLNGGTIKNSSLVSATITHSAASSTQTVNGVRPTIIDFARVGGPGYVTNDHLDFTVTTSTATTVTGTPRIYVGIGENIRYASYYSGSGTNTLTFRYTIVAADHAPIPGQGFALDNVIMLNGGTIKDSSGNDLKSLVFRRPINTTVTVNA
jgi:uncharacterized protein YuzE